MQSTPSIASTKLAAYMFDSVIPSLRQLGHFSEAELATVCSKLTLRRFAKGAYMAKEGRVSTAFYFLQQGCCRYYHISDKGIELTLNLFVAGDWMMDYQSFVSQKPSANNLQAFEACELAELTVHALHELMNLSGTYFQLGRVFGTVQPFLPLDKTASPAETYAALLAQRPAVLQKFPLKYIASYLNIAPETLSRIRRKQPAIS